MTQAALSLKAVALPQERKLLTIASGKGGVGKTWLSITLAHALARLGDNVLLFDGDLGLANVDIQLGQIPAHDLSDVIAGRLTLAQAVTRFGDGTALGSAFDLIAGSSGSGALTGLTRDRLIGLRRALIDAATGYDRVILDLGAGLDQPVTILAHNGGICLVVVSTEPTSLTDAYAFIKLRRMRDPAADIRIVVNAAPTRRHGDKTWRTLAKACTSFLGFEPPLQGIIRQDSHVPDAIRAQMPLLLRHPECPAALDVMALARSLSGG